MDIPGKAGIAIQGYPSLGSWNSERDCMDVQSLMKGSHTHATLLGTGMVPILLVYYILDVNIVDNELLLIIRLTRRQEGASERVKCISRAPWPKQPKGWPWKGAQRPRKG